MIINSCYNHSKVHPNLIILFFLCNTVLYCLPYAVGKQLSIPLINLGRKWKLRWWWWWWFICFSLIELIYWKNEVNLEEPARKAACLPHSFFGDFLDLFLLFLSLSDDSERRDFSASRPEVLLLFRSRSCTSDLLRSDLFSKLRDRDRFDLRRSRTSDGFVLCVGDLSSRTLLLFDFKRFSGDLFWRFVVMVTFLLSFDLTTVSVSSSLVDLSPDSFSDAGEFERFASLRLSICRTLDSWNESAGFVNTGSLSLRRWNDQVSEWFKQFTR